MISRPALLLSLPLALALAAGCNKTPNTGASTGANTNAAAQPTSDQQVAVDVQAKILGDSAVQNKQMTINANSGVVTLSGQVGSDAERTAASNDAAGVAGVKTVVNNLTVSSAATQRAATVDTPEVPPAVAHNARSIAHETRRKTPAAITTAHNPTPAAAPAVTANAASPARNYFDGGSGPMAAADDTARNMPPPPPPPPAKVSIPAGTGLSVRLSQALASDTNQDGDTFHGTLQSPIVVDEQVVVPQGAEVEGRVVSAAKAGKFEGKPQLTLTLYKLAFNGRTYNLDTDQWTRTGPSRGKNSAEKVGGGAAVGAILGGIFGGGKGAAIGAASGGGLGAGAQTIGKAQQVQLGPEAVLSFRLQSPISVTPSANANNEGGSGRRKLDPPQG